MGNFKSFVSKYKHAWLFVVFFFGIMPWFDLLEKYITEDSDYTVLHVKLDDKIPFHEIFAIPYVLWYFYFVFTAVYLFFVSVKDFYKFGAYIMIGMAICLFTCTVFPNGQDLRVKSFPRQNFMTDIVNKFYTTDTPTNVFPSMHCFNSIVFAVSLNHCEKIAKSKFKWFILIFTVTLSILIMLSTVFIKQHSVVDVYAAIVLGIILYPLIYTEESKKLINKYKKDSPKEKVN
ncbi:hypothetical protein BCR32DRAFT_267126, partial [Anaeromyces robustus]